MQLRKPQRRAHEAGVFGKNGEDVAKTNDKRLYGGRRFMKKMVIYVHGQGAPRRRRSITGAVSGPGSYRIRLPGPVAVGGKKGISAVFLPEADAVPVADADRQQHRGAFFHAQGCSERNSPYYKRYNRYRVKRKWHVCAARGGNALDGDFGSGGDFLQKGAGCNGKQDSAADFPV